MEHIISNTGWTLISHQTGSKKASSNENRIPKDTVLPMRLAGEGEMVEIVSLSGGKSFRDRLVGLGLGIGVRIEIIQNNMNGKILIGRDGSRLFLGGGMAHKIQVKIV